MSEFEGSACHCRFVLPLPLRRAIQLLYLLPRRRGSRRRQVAVEGPLVEEEKQPEVVPPSGHLLMDISLVRGAQARDLFYLLPRRRRRRRRQVAVEGPLVDHCILPPLLRQRLR